MKRADEEYCKSKFDAFLKRYVDPTAVVWEEVSQRDEPPDYFLHLHGVKFAVEVTTLMETIPVGTAALPEAAIIGSLWHLVDEVERIAGSEGHLHGMYLVDFSRPIDGFRDVRHQIQSDLLDYIQATQGLSSAPEKTVFKQGNQWCRIRKLQDSPDKVVQAGPNRGKSEGDAAEDICNLLEERLVAKNHALRDIRYPKILLLCDSYHFASLDMYRDCISQLSLLASFHTVFVLQGNGDGFVFHSEDPSWLM